MRHFQPDSTGFNFRRSVEYRHDELGTRRVAKHYGVRIFVLISCVGLLSVATLIAYFVSSNLVYRSVKYHEDDDDSEETV